MHVDETPLDFSMLLVAALGLACFVAMLVIVGVVGWLIYRATRPPAPKTCPHCGKPLP